MATLKLTKPAVEAAEPGAADVYLWDSVLPRFGLRLTPAAARIYLVQYRVRPAAGGPPKTRRITIGQHGKPWTVDKAREQARKLLAAVDLGRDPFADREAEQEARRLAAETAAERVRAAELRRLDAFEAVVERYVSTALASNRSGAETARLLRHGPAKTWAGRHVAEVRRADVADVLDAIKRRSPAVARATYAALRGLFSWCVERDLVAVSPCIGVTAPPRPEARDRVLSDDELRTIWAASDGLGVVFGPVVKLLMLTGQRRAEVAGMRWDELDLDAGKWRIPKERTKNGRAHEIDLGPEALRIIQAMPHTSDHVFPARSQGAARGFSATKRKLDALGEGVLAEEAPETEGLAAWRLHDLRRTAATGMAAMGFPPHVVERVLNHVSGVQSGLVGVYQRHEYRAERQAALLAWGAHVAAVIEGGEKASNVVPLRA